MTDETFEISGRLLLVALRLESHFDLVKNGFYRQVEEVDIERFKKLGSPLRHRSPSETEAYYDGMAMGLMSARVEIDNACNLPEDEIDRYTKAALEHASKEDRIERSKQYSPVMTQLVGKVATD